MVGLENGEYLFVDAVENRILSKITDNSPASQMMQLLINHSSTGLFGISQNHAYFYQFNNCMSPVFYPVRNCLTAHD